MNARMLLVAIFPDVVQPNYSGFVGSSRTNKPSDSICNPITICEYFHKT